MDHQDHNMGTDSSIPNNPYYYEPPDASYNMSYGNQMGYSVGQHAPSARGIDMHQPTTMSPYSNLGLIQPSQYAGNVYAGSPPHGSLPLSGSPAPPSPGGDMYGPLSPPVSGSETSADGLYHHSNSSGANSRSSSRANSLVHRTARYNPTPSPTSSTGRRRSRSQDSDEDDNLNMGMPYGVENLAHTRKEATRRQRIEAEQRRRDELRDGYAKLKDVLPVSNQKSSKVSLLERATNHIIALDKANKDLQAKISALEAEMQRLRGVNEKISLSANNTPSPGHLHQASKALSPPAEITTSGHSLTSVKGQLPPSEHSSPSASENGYQ